MDLLPFCSFISQFGRQLFKILTSCQWIKKKNVFRPRCDGLALVSQIPEAINSHDEVRQSCLYFKDIEGGSSRSCIDMVDVSYISWFRRIFSSPFT